MIDWRPDEVALFQNRYARWGRLWSGVGLGSVVVGLGLFGADLGIAGVLLAVFGGTFGFIFGFAFWLTGRGAQRQLDAIREGRLLARWSVDRDRWDAWHQERENTLMLGAAIGCGLLVLGGLVAAGLMWEDGDVDAARWTAAITVVAAPVVWLVIKAHRAPLPPRSMRSVPLIIGPDGVLTVGAYLQWRGFGVGLLGADVQAEPPTLNVRYRVSTQHGTVDHTMNLPVPADRLAEAAEAARALNPGF